MKPDGALLSILLHLIAMAGLNSGRATAENITICSTQEIEVPVEYTGTLVGSQIPYTNTNLSCSVRLTGTQPNTWFELYVNEFPSGCSSNFFIVNGNDGERVCYGEPADQPTRAKRKVFFFRNETAIEIRFFTSNWTQNDRLNITYRVAAVIDVGDSQHSYKVDRRHGYIVSHSSFDYTSHYRLNTRTSLVLLELPPGKIQIRPVFFSLEPECADFLTIKSVGHNLQGSLCNSSIGRNNMIDIDVPDHNLLIFEFVTSGNVSKLGFLLEYKLTGFMDTPTTQSSNASSFPTTSPATSAESTIISTQAPHSSTSYHGYPNTTSTDAVTVLPEATISVSGNTNLTAASYNASSSFTTSPDTYAKSTMLSTQATQSTTSFQTFSPTTSKDVVTMMSASTINDGVNTTTPTARLNASSPTAASPATSAEAAEPTTTSQDDYPTTSKDAIAMSSASIINNDVNTNLTTSSSNASSSFTTSPAITADSTIISTAAAQLTTSSLIFSSSSSNTATATSSAAVTKVSINNAKDVDADEPMKSFRKTSGNIYIGVGVAVALMAVVLVVGLMIYLNKRKRSSHSRKAKTEAVTRESPGIALPLLGGGSDGEAPNVIGSVGDGASGKSSDETRLTLSSINEYSLAEPLIADYQPTESAVAEHHFIEPMGVEYQLAGPIEDDHQLAGPIGDDHQFAGPIGDECQLDGPIGDAYENTVAIQRNEVEKGLTEEYASVTAAMNTKRDLVNEMVENDLYGS